MPRPPKITTERAAEIYEEMLLYRRGFYADSEFFKMTELWDRLVSGDGEWKIQLFKSNLGADYARKAGVIALGHRVTLSVDEELWDRAASGCRIANYILAHELGHLGLDHHAKAAVVKNFKLYVGPNGNMSNIPPTLEELEANLSAVFLQCGVALENPRLSAMDLARRAYSDVTYVRKAQTYVRLDVFQRVLRRPRRSVPRVIL
jgi:hypothetical protein